MTQKLDFYLLESRDHDDFSNKVQARLNEGWRFHGTVFAFPDYIPGPKVEGLRYIQAFIKERAEWNRAGFVTSSGNTIDNP